MLFHVSIEADDPRKTAEALAELWGGEALPFPPVGAGSWVALAGDEKGSLIEVYPRGTELHEGEGQDGGFGRQAIPRRHGATHFAMASTLSPTSVFAVAERNGWHAKYCRRDDMFGLIEMWIDGCLMVEVLTPHMQREYMDAITIENWRKKLEPAPVAEAA